MCFGDVTGKQAMSSIRAGFQKQFTVFKYYRHGVGLGRRLVTVNTKLQTMRQLATVVVRSARGCVSATRDTQISQGATTGEVPTPAM